MKCSRAFRKFFSLRLIFLLTFFGFILPNAVFSAPRSPAPQESFSIEESRAINLNNSIAQRYAQKLDKIHSNWDNERKVIKNISGLQVPAQKIFSGINSVTKENSDFLAKEFMRQNSDALGIANVDGLKQRIAWVNTTSPAGPVKEVITHYSQEHWGLPVIDSETSVIFRSDKLQRFRSNALGNINVDTAPKLTAQDAFELAKKIETSHGYAQVALFPRPEEIKDLGPAPTPDQLRLGKSRLVIFPNRNFLGLQPNLAWEILLQGSPSFPLSAIYYIDATNGLYLDRRETRQKADVWGRVYGCHFPTNPSDTGNICSAEQIDAVTVRAQNLISGDIYSSLTDEDGNYELNNLNSANAHSFAFKLSGPQDVFNWPNLISGIYNPPMEAAYSAGSVIFNQANNHYFNNLTSNYYDAYNQATNILEHFSRLRGFWGRTSISPFDFFGGSVDTHLAVIINQGDLSQIDHTWFSANSAGMLTTSQEADYDGFFSFENRTFNGSGQLANEAHALDADIINHEFTHLIQLKLNSSYFSSATAERAAMIEGIPDYWAASISNESLLYEGVFFLPNESRDVWNYLKYEDLDPLANDAHDNGLILAGALWHMRVALISKYGSLNGIERADDLTIRAMKSFPMAYRFGDMLEEILDANDPDFNPDNGTPDKAEICAAFCSFHHICTGTFPGNWDCNHTPGSNPTPTATPGIGRQNKISVPITNTNIDASFSQVLGSAAASNLQNFTLEYRPYGGLGPWTSNSITLGGQGGTQNVINNLLASLSPTSLVNKCYYDLKLTSNTTDGSSLTTQHVVKHRSATHDEMPRMVCIFRTANEGGENDACEMLAIVSDPKEAYYNLASTDWRKGRPHLLASRSSLQYNAGAPGSSTYGPALCDPDDANGDCLRDCWNITGTNSNNSGGNDGRDNVFCKAGAGCNPVSFSGCASNDTTCVNSAVQGLESVYHKVLYFHYANWDLPYSYWPWGHVRRFMNCSDDGGDQFYSLKAFSGVDSYGYVTTLYSRTAQVGVGRSGAAVPGDIFDGFDQLYSSSSGPAVYSMESIPKTIVARDSISPTTDCSRCGCPSTHPYCNTAQGGICEAKCSDGTPFGACFMSGNQVRFCNNGTLINGCNRPECTGLTCGNGLMCNTTTGLCQSCINNSDCADANSCTLNDRCSSGSCTSEYLPNDCASLPSGQCGNSPSGCHYCGCDCAHKCVQDAHSPTKRCVINNKCDQRKCAPCKNLFASALMSTFPNS